jgi:pimeloyl-[acyl-carrier protein] methyl ester esterase
VPVLSIFGGKDAIVVPDVGRSVAKYARHATVVEFPECGHSPFLEDGPRYREVLLDFLRRLG